MSDVSAELLGLLVVEESLGRLVNLLEVVGEVKGSSGPNRI